MQDTNSTHERTPREAPFRARHLVRGSLLAFALLGLVGFAPAATGQDGGALAPTIDSFEPASGPTGTYVLVYGSGFSAEDELLFGGLLVAFDASDDLLAFTVPGVGAMDYNIEISSTRGNFGVCCFTVTESGAPAEPEPEAGDPGTGSGSGGECAEVGKNVQCNAFGRISQDFQRDIKGERITITATVTLHQSYADRDARWILFSVRNGTGQSGSPVSLSLNKFETAHGDVVTTEILKPGPNELNLWVHVIDVPVGTPITLEVDVGASERGAFRLETLIMAFDRGYAPIQDNRQDASLFSFTLLGVNKETGGAPSAASSGVNRLPGFEAAFALTALLAAVAVVVSRRREA